MRDRTFSTVPAGAVIKSDVSRTMSRFRARYFLGVRAYQRNQRHLYVRPESASGLRFCGRFLASLTASVTVMLGAMARIADLA